MACLFAYSRKLSRNKDPCQRKSSLHDNLPASSSDTTGNGPLTNTVTCQCRKEGLVGQNQPSILLIVEEVVCIGRRGLQYHEPPDICHRQCSTPSARSGFLLLRLLLLFAQIFKVGNVIFLSQTGERGQTATLAGLKSLRRG